MSESQNPSGSKLTAMDAAHSNGKAACLAADSFALTQTSLQDTVHAHSDAIEAMQGNYHSLEQQVKSIARVMASQNVTKLTENMKIAQDDLRRSLLYTMNEKHKEVISTVEREVSEVSDAKIGLLKKIDTVEQHILSVVNAKLDEAAQSRKDNAEDIAHLKDVLDNYPALADKTNSVIKQLESKLADMRAEFRSFVSEQSQNDREQDKAAMSLTAEVRTALEAAKDRINEETKALSKLIHKHGDLLKDEVKEVREQIDKENTERIDSFKIMQKFVKDEVDKVKVACEQKVYMIESTSDYKVRPAMAALKEMKRTIDEEACHRDTADKDLARRLAKEIQERHQDEERLVSLIHTCQDAVSKLHRPS